MGTNVTPEVLISMLVAGGLLALVKRSLSGPPSLEGAVNVVLRSTTCVGDTEYNLLVCESAGPGAAGHLKLEDPLAILLQVATVFAFLHTIDGRGSLVHGNLNIDAISMVAGTIIVSGFEHCSFQPDESPPGATESPDPTSGGTSWKPLTPGHLPSMAPELVSTGIRTTQTDVYAFGMLMFWMYTGEYPFARLPTRSSYIDAAPVHLGSGKRPPREAIEHQHFSDELWALMDECWAQNPSARPKMADVRARLAQLVEDRASRSRGDEEPPVTFETE